MNLLSVFGVRVMEDLQHAVFEIHPVWSNSTTSFHAAGQQSYGHVWEEFYQIPRMVEIIDHGQLTHLEGICQL